MSERLPNDAGANADGRARVVEGTPGVLVFLAAWLSFESLGDSAEL